MENCNNFRKFLPEEQSEFSVIMLPDFRRRNPGRTKETDSEPGSVFGFVNSILPGFRIRTHIKPKSVPIH
jgi:hypothetical protein